MTKVMVITEVERYVTRPRDESDEWDQGDMSGYVTNVYAKVDPRDDDYYYSGDTLSKDFDELMPGAMLYAVVADYESGSTFGRDGGHACILDVFDNKADAESLARAALKADAKESSFTWRGKSYYRAWVGYFERLQSLDVWYCPLRTETQPSWPECPDCSPGHKRGY